MRMFDRLLLIIAANIGEFPFPTKLFEEYFCRPLIFYSELKHLEASLLGEARVCGWVNTQRADNEGYSSLSALAQ